MYSNGVSGSYNPYSSTVSSYNDTQVKESASKETTSEKTPQSKKEQAAAVYEPSSSAKAMTQAMQKNSKAENQAIVDQLKSDMAQRKQQLVNMVQKMLGRQANTWKTGQGSGSNIYQLLRSGNFTADADIIAQAKKDVADDGYWGVEQTSDRILSFAKALSGGDSSKADELLAAFKKGYKLAGGEWGERLPDLCKRTYDATLEKFEAWKNGTEE